MKTKKRLERDQEKAVVSGVLAGMANYFGQDPVLFRLMAITFLILTGIFPGILLYFGAWFVMPKKARQDSQTAQQVDYEVAE